MPLDSKTLPDKLKKLAPHDLAFIDAERKWIEIARPKQILPIDGWNTALALSGRGAGKTKTSSSWDRRMVGMYPGIIGHVVAPTFSDLRGTTFEGVSGLLNTIPPEMVDSYNRSHFELRLKNGSLIRGFSADEPNRLRGPQSHFTAGDEVAAWKRAEETLANIVLSTRLSYTTKAGRIIQPQKFYTTTPRPLAWLKKMRDEADLVITESTFANRANLAEAFFAEVDKYDGLPIGRQELYGEILDISEAAIIKRTWLKLWPAGEPLPWFDFIFVAQDTAFTERTFDKKTFEADPTVSGTWGVFKHRGRWNLMLLNGWEDLLGFPDLLARAKKEMRLVYGRRVDTLFKPVIGPAWHQEQVKKPDLMVIENKGSGISLIQMLEKEGVPCQPYNPGGFDKLSRLHAVSHVPYHGRVWIPESPKHKGEPREYAVPMIDQVCAYSGPGTTAHDDWVDMCSMSWLIFADRFIAGEVGAKSDDPSEQGRPVAIPQPGDREYVSEDGGARWNEEERGAYG